MGIHVVIEPSASYSAEVVSPFPGVRQVVATGYGATFAIQVRAGYAGFVDAARFAQSLAAAAAEFGEWCAAENRKGSYPRVEWPHTPDGFRPSQGE